MPTRSKPKVPDHLEGARSARCRGGFTATIDGLQYIAGHGRHYELDHPLVAHSPERFEPSGEHPLETRPIRDRRPKPRKQRADLETVLVVRCAEGTCDYAAELDPNDVAALRHAQRQHVHETTT